MNPYEKRLAIEFYEWVEKHRFYIETSEQRTHTLSELFEIYADQQCEKCGKRLRDHYTGTLGYTRCVDEYGILYGTLKFKPLANETKNQTHP